MIKNNNLSGLSGSETVKNITQNFQDAFKEIQSFQKAYQEFVEKISELNKNLYQNTKSENPYELTIKEMEKEQSALDSEVKSYSSSRKQKLEIDKWMVGLKSFLFYCLISIEVRSGAIFNSNWGLQGVSPCCDLD